MKKLFLMLLMVPGIITALTGQNSNEEFTPEGAPLALIFSNFHTSFSDGHTRPVFQITRAYLGYDYHFSEDWYAKVVLDVGNPGAGKHEMAAYLKNAYFQYTAGKFKTYFGMISTTQFKVSEKIWGNRYMLKSYQDEYRFNSSADLGVNFEYAFADFLSADFSIVNGEGYKRLQKDSVLRPGIGITLKPVKNITARIYADRMGDDVVQKSLAALLAYTDNKLVVAGEYNYQQNYARKDGQDLYGTSFYATYKPEDNLKLFGRMDVLKSNRLSSTNSIWNIEDDGTLLVAGVEYSPVKGVKLTPNLRSWNPAKENKPNTTFLYLNCELKF